MHEHPYRGIDNSLSIGEPQAPASLLPASSLRLPGPGDPGDFAFALPQRSDRRKLLR